jgi:hypothetical protein
MSPATTEHLLRLGDTVLVAPVEHPLLNLPAPDQARPAEQLQMLAAGRLADAEFLGNELGAHAVPDQVAIALRREMRLRVTEPLQDQESFLTAQRLDQIHIQHGSIMEDS